MIEIITEKVKMPKPSECRYVKKCPSGNINGKWQVYDTHDKIVIYTGSFENVALASHNLNKKYYKGYVALYGREK